MLCSCYILPKTFGQALAQFCAHHGTGRQGQGAVRSSVKDELV